MTEQGRKTFTGIILSIVNGFLFLSRFHKAIDAIYQTGKFILINATKCFPSFLSLKLLAGVCLLPLQGRGKQCLICTLIFAVVILSTLKEILEL